MYESSYDGGGLGAIVWLVMIGLYVYFAFAQYKISQKAGCADKAWWAFIPILNTFLLIETAGKDWWWFLLCLVPLVNIVAFAVLWIETAKASGHSGIWGFLVLIPFINFVAVGVMAFTGPGGNYGTFPQSGTIDTRKHTPVG